MTDRKRDPLPEGYKYGDAIRIASRMPRLPDDRVAEILGGMVTANVIEAEEFASDAERHPVIEGFIAQRDLGDEA